MGEVVIILVLALLLLGPQRLPDAASMVPPGGVPTQPAGEVPQATTENVPGLDAALVEVKPAPAFNAEGVAKAS